MQSVLPGETNAAEHLLCATDRPRCCSTGEQFRERRRDVITSGRSLIDCRSSYREFDLNLRQLMLHSLECAKCTTELMSVLTTVEN